MARTTQELLDQLLRLLPSQYAALEPLLAGLAAAQGQIEISADTLQQLGLIDQATAEWLTLHAHGLGIRRTVGESDGSLRLRIRDVDDLVTGQAILAIVDALLSPNTASLTEWYEEPFLGSETDEGAWLGSMRLSAGPSSFQVIVPETITDAQVLAVVAAVERSRAAGVHWRLVKDVPPVGPPAMAFLFSTNSTRLSTRARTSDTFPELGGARTYMAWVGATGLPVGASAGVISSIDDDPTPKPGQALRLTSGGLVEAAHEDTGGVLRTLTTGGSLAGTWRPITAGWEDSGGSSTTHRVSYDAAANRASAVVAADHEPSAPELLEFGYQEGEGGIGGYLLQPIAVLSDWISGTEFDTYIADGGQNGDALLTGAPISCAPYPNVSIGQDVRSYAVDVAGDEVFGPSLHGIPADDAGPGEGLTPTTGYVATAWTDTTASDEKTLITEIRLDASWAGSFRRLIGRPSDVDGIEITIDNSGTSIQFRLYEGGVATPRYLNSIAAGGAWGLGDTVFAVFRVPAGGAGSATCAVFNTAGVLLDDQSTLVGSTVSDPFGSAVWLGNTYTGNVYDETHGQLLRCAQFHGGWLTDQQVTDYITQTGTPPTPTEEIAGVDTIGVADRADAWRGDSKRRFITPYKDGSTPDTVSVVPLAAAVTVGAALP